LIRLRTVIAAPAALLTLVLASWLPLPGSGVALAQTDSAQPASPPTESLYVIEQLTVSVNSTADGSGERIAQIKSGDRVEVLEHSGDQTRVKLATGEEGWVRASYLSAGRPLREQLRASSDLLDKLRQERSKLEADLASARKAASAAPAVTLPAAEAAAPRTSDLSAAASEASSSSQAEPAATDSIHSNPPLFADTGILPSRPSWFFSLIAAVVALGGGFALGWRMLDRRIRAKYGGLRIY
jgi:SH3 domain protein